jgi:alginate O-acetyltransferase complex protein AlgI
LGIFIHSVRHKSSVIRRFSLALAVFLNIGILFRQKYFDFFVEIINLIFSANLPLSHAGLPIGISFFTFQGMTYVIDLYRNNVTVQKNPLKVALYIAFFPQLIAGPIVRYRDIEHQMGFRSVTLDKFHSGVTRFIVGLGKKVIIANHIAVIADGIFNQSAVPHDLPTAWLGVICYMVQIYFDFSGYSDMAIGLGRMFGFDFLENFNYPYISSSVREFWRRWHISLSTFFRDYLYIPLGGNQRGNVYFNLFAVFLATGLWHGASVNFVLWGLWHGFFIMAERILNKRFYCVCGGGIQSIIKHIYVLLIVAIGWVIFRTENIEQVILYLRVMFGFGSETSVKVSVLFYVNSFNMLILLLGVIFSMPITTILKEKILSEYPINGAMVVSLARTIFMCLVFLVSEIMILNSSYNPFIYFRF